MRRQPAQGCGKERAAGLLIALLAILVVLGAPISMGGFSKAGQAPAVSSQSVQSPVARALPSTVTRKAEKAAAPFAGPSSFHAIDEVVSPGSVSWGTVGMGLLAAFSVLLLAAAFFLQTKQPHES